MNNELTFTSIKNSYVEIETMRETLNQRFLFMTNVFTSKRQSLFAFASAFLFGFALFSLGKLSLIFVNIGFGAGIRESVIILILSVLFGVNLSLLVARIISAAEYGAKSIGTTSLASALGILFSGCASCCLTLASYVGLGSFAALLPWNGVEINVIAILLLAYSIWNLSAPITCSIHSSKKQKKVHIN